MTKRMLIMLLLCGVVFGGVFGMKWFEGAMRVGGLCAILTLLLKYRVKRMNMFV